MVDLIDNRTPKDLEYEEETKTQKGLALFPIIFIVSLLIPIVLYLGPARLSPYRIVLLILLIPCVLTWISGKAGKIRAADIFVCLHAFWAFVALIAVHGLAKAIEPGGAYIAETVAAYLIARCYIRNQKDMEALARTLFLVVLILLPFAAIEAFTGKRFLLDFFGLFFKVFPPVLEGQRMGLYRSVTVFQHAILFGCFCASILSLVVLVRDSTKSKFVSGLRSIPVALTTFFSLSSAPLLVFGLQLILLGYDYVTQWVKGRWIWLISSLTFLYFVIDLTSNRTPIKVLVSYLTFNTQTGYYRIHIWNFGTAEVFRHPIFGIGLNDWYRPKWMASASIDHFWLYTTMKFGVPGLIFLIAALLAIIIPLTRAQFTNENDQICRKAWILAIIALSLAGCTVHYWNALLAHFFFLVGCGVWMLDINDQAQRPRSSKRRRRRITPLDQLKGVRRPSSRLSRSERA